MKITLKYFICFLPFLFNECSGNAHGVVYVSSSYGSDFNTGKTREDPLKTIGNAVSKGDTICLAAGDIFYEYVVLRNQVLTRFGEGGNPELNGFRYITGSPWTLVDHNIWKINLTVLNSTGYNVSGTSELNNVGCFYEPDKDLIHGKKCPKLSDLQTDWDFFQADIMTYHRNGNKCFDCLYLYFAGDPNLLNLAISVGSHYGITLHDSSVEQVNVKGFGTGGITVYGKSNVRNCKIDLVGGSMMLNGDVTTSLGNGIDFWVGKDAYDCVIEGNYISRAFDCGGSIQAHNGGQATPKNISFRDNLISHCCQGWEDFLVNDPNVMYENCRFENNIVVYSGDSGFGYPDQRVKYCNVLGDNYAGDRGMIIRKNVFIGGNYYCSSSYNGKYHSNKWDGNIHYVYRGAYILSNYFGTKDVLRIPLSGSPKDVIAHYRELTNDYSTSFRVRSQTRIDTISNKAIRKYLNSHKY